MYFLKAAIIAFTCILIAACGGGAKDANGSSQTLPPQAPAAPLNVTASYAPAQVDLSWTNSSGATSYLIKRSNSLGGSFSSIGTSLNNSYTDASASPSATYYYIVDAVNANGSSSDSAAIVVLVPNSTPSSIAGPGRGFITNYVLVDGKALGNLGPYAPVTDGVGNYTWTELTNPDGSYRSGNRLINDLRTAQSVRGKLNINIMSLSTYGSSPVALPDGSSASILVPVGQTAAKYNGWYAYDSNGDRYYVPDWNNAYFLSDAKQLLQNLSNDIKAQGLYNALLFIDIGMWGNYGENETGGVPDINNAPGYDSGQAGNPTAWSSSPLHFGKGSAGAAIMYPTTASAHAYVDMYVAAFPDKQLLAQPYLATLYSYAWTLATEYPIGWRANCLGTEYSTASGQWCYNFINSPESVYPTLSTRWQVAPFVAEFGGSGVATLEAPLSDIIKAHISTIDEVNIESPGFPAADAYLQADAKAAGYNYFIPQLAMPAMVARGAPFILSTSWVNLGIAPAYRSLDSWQVQYILTPAGQAVSISPAQTGATQQASGTVSGVNCSAETLQSSINFPTGVASGANDVSIISGANIYALLASNCPAQIVNDSISLPTNIPAGNYVLSVAVSDPTGYRAPMLLNLPGRTAAGTYPLVNVSVR